MKVCDKCQLPKEDVEFVFKRKAKNERRNTCRSCCKEYTKEHYKRNKSVYVERAKKFTSEQTQSNRHNLFLYLSDKRCVDCGNPDFRVFDFDHKEGTKKVNNISNMVFRYNWNTILLEIEKCEIRCANCHRIKTGIQLGWFKK